MDFLFLFLHAPATTRIYTLSLHDALPISSRNTSACSSKRILPPSDRCCRISVALRTTRVSAAISGVREGWPAPPSSRSNAVTVRSEEHTSELQSLAYLVCRLLLEKKKKNI